VKTKVAVVSYRFIAPTAKSQPDSMSLKIAAVKVSCFAGDYTVVVVILPSATIFYTFPRFILPSQVA
jgi:hypothetical protein